MKRIRQNLPYLGILVMAAAIYAVLSFSDNLWADEAYTFAMIHHSFGEMWRITAADVHPPLYYFAAKIFASVFGYGEYGLRFFSGCFYLVLLAIGGSQLTKLFDRKTGLCFMTIFALYPFAIEQATVVRMYPMAALAVFLCALYAYRAWLGNRIWDWVGFTLSGVCAAYTHYFALVSAGIIYGLLFLCLLVKKRSLWKPWLIASLVTIVLYLPWLKCFVEQLVFKVNNDYWIEPITFATLVNYAMSILHANGFGYFPLYFAGILLGLLVILRFRGDLGILALLVPVLTALVGIAASVLVRPVFIVRYLIPSAPLLIFFLAYGWGKIQNKTARSAILAVLLTAFSSNLIYAFTTIASPDNKIGAQFVEHMQDAECYVVVNDNSLHISQVLSYYDPKTPIYVPDKLGADNPYPNKLEIGEFSIEEVDKYVLMTDVQMPLDACFREGFRAENIGTYVDVENPVDVWIMTRE